MPFTAVSPSSCPLTSSLHQHLLLQEAPLDLAHLPPQHVVVIPHTDPTTWHFLFPDLCLPWKHRILRAGLGLILPGASSTLPQLA